MKIRGRLIAAFLIITLFPLCAGALSFHKTVQEQTDSLIDYYSADPGIHENYGLVLNPLRVLYSIALEDFNAVAGIADHHPDELLDKDILDMLTNNLATRDTFIVVRHGRNECYIGDNKCYEKVPSLPYFTEYTEGNNNNICINTQNSFLIREKDFYFTDNTEGQVFLITDLSKLIPYWKDSVFKILFYFFSIIVLTGMVLILWLYHSIARPLNILHIATMQIGAGNLDSPVRVISSDEIGELCRDFEEMRIRLKSILEERIKYEQDTREMMGSISHYL